MIRKKKINHQVILPGLLLLFFAACQEATPQSEIPTTPFLTDTLVSSPFQQAATLTPFPSPLPLDTLTPSPTSQSSITLTSSPIPSGTQIAVTEFLLCSPLAWETIPELWEIVSDPYNPPPMGSDERHQGVDFSHYSRKGYKTIEGEPVQAVLAGRVVSVIKNRLPYGNMVMIETHYHDLPTGLQNALGMAAGESLYLLYAHFKQAPLVSLGDPVVCGQVIGDVGLTGYNIVNPHLHLEARLGRPGKVFESMAFYTTSATEQEMENYKLWRMSGEFRHIDPMVLFNKFDHP